MKKQTFTKQAVWQAAAVGVLGGRRSPFLPFRADWNRTDIPAGARG